MRHARPREPARGGPGPGCPARQLASASTWSDVQISPPSPDGRRADRRLPLRWRALRADRSRRARRRTAAARAPARTGTAPHPGQGDAGHVHFLWVRSTCAGGACPRASRRASARSAGQRSSAGRPAGPSRRVSARPPRRRCRDPAAVAHQFIDYAAGRSRPRRWATAYPEAERRLIVSPRAASRASAAGLRRRRGTRGSDVIARARRRGAPRRRPPWAARSHACPWR